MRYKDYFAIAIPFIISTITQPLLGAVDTAVIGQLSNPSYIGGVAVGAVIFNTLYWLLGFLRVSTSGFSAQSLGTNKKDDIYLAYLRPFVIGLFISFVFILLQVPILKGAMKIYNPEPVVLESATKYFKILIWGAPLVLLGYVNLGWIMGRKLIKETMFIQISSNVVNIILDFVFVFKFNMKVEGVAYATLISQLYAFIIGIIVISKKISLQESITYKNEIFNKSEIKKVMFVNLDLMIRTTCLLTMTNMFVARGNKFGANILAANAILFQIQYIISYFYDGLANASSIFIGKAIGSKNKKEFKDTIKISNISILYVAVFMSLIMFFFSKSFINIFTDIKSVLDISLQYSFWLSIFPLVIGVGLVYYGIFTGATLTGPIRNSMIYSLVAFLICYFLAIPIWGNHGLWLSFIIFSLGRSVFLYLEKSKLDKVLELK